VPAELAPASGRLVAGRYQLDSVLGRGGAGIVWKAEDVLLRRVVAVKEVHLPATQSDEERRLLRERVLREARTAAAVRHPVLVTVFDVVEDEDRPWLVLEFIEARTLSARVAERPLTPAEAARIGIDLLAALRAVHRAGIQHRDVKPGNVLIEPDGRPRLTDFGIASTTSEPGLTTTGVLVGSPSYLPPERARGGAGGPESDLWGLAATLYTAVEGVPPYPGSHPLAVLTAVVEGRRRPAVRAGALEPLLADLLDLPAEERPSADEVQRRLVDAAGPDLAGLLLDPALSPGIPEPGRASDSDAATDTLVAGGTVTYPGTEPNSTTNRSDSAPADSGEGMTGTQALPLGVPQQDRRQRRPWHRRRSVALAVAVVAALLVVGTVLLLGQRSSPSPAVAGPAGSGAAPVAALPPANPDATATSASSPAGWTRYTDPAGWSVAVPANWKRTALGRSGVDFVEPDTGSYLHVETSSTPPASVSEDLAVQERQLAPRVSNYARVRLDPADGQTGTRAADWEFTFDLAGSPLHAVDRGLTTSNTGYSLYWQTPANRWTVSKATVAGLFGSFATG
jgi:serine/threonine protein kinase